MAGIVHKVGHSYKPLTVRGIVGRFWKRFEEQLGGSWALKISMLNTETDQETETYKFTGQVPQMREWVGQRQPKAQHIYSYQLSSKKFEMSEDLDVDDIRRDKTPQIMARIGEMSAAAAEHWEELLTTLIEANGVCYDGQNFFDTDHQIGDQAVAQNNALAVGQISALNVADANNPTREEWASILVEAVGWLWSFKDDRNRPTNGTAKQFMLMVPPKMAGNAQSAVRARLTGQGGSNILKDQDFNIMVQPNARLSSATKGYLFRLDSDFKPFIAQDELPLQTQVLGPGTQYEILHNAWFFGLKAIRNVGYGEPLHALSLQLS